MTFPYGHSHFTIVLIIFFKKIKVSQYPFKQNKNTLKNIKVPLYTHFHISLNVVRPTFFNICNLSFSHFPNISKITDKVRPQTDYFFYFMSSCTDRIVVFNIFLLIFSQRRDVPAIFFFANIF